MGGSSSPNRSPEGADEPFALIASGKSVFSGELAGARHPPIVYDLIDVGFNAAFGLMAIVASLLVGLARKLASSND